MIPFLVKLANLLDDRGQHPMAREVDDLIEKLAQMSSVDQNQSIAPPPEKLQSLPEDAPKLQSLPEDAPAAAPVTAPKVVDKPSKKPPRKNPLVLQIQQNMGMKPTGVWDKPTNKKFIELMKSRPEYAKMMEGNTFKGAPNSPYSTLQQAVQLTQQLQTLKEMESQPEDKASKAPPTPAAPAAPQYKSQKYDLLDVQDEINRLVNVGKLDKEAIENLIGSATIQADQIPSNQLGGGGRQEAFEKMFKQLGRKWVK